MSPSLLLPGNNYPSLWCYEPVVPVSVTELVTDLRFEGIKLNSLVIITICNFVDHPDSEVQSLNFRPEIKWETLRL